MIINDNEEKSKIAPVHKLFIPVVIILSTLIAFGAWKLHTIEASRGPIQIRQSEMVAPSTLLGLSTASLKTSGDILATTTLVQKAVTGAYVASRGGTSYYLPSCSGAKRISEKNKIYFESKVEAERLGYKPAKTCKIK